MEEYQMSFRRPVNTVSEPKALAADDLPSVLRSFFDQIVSGEPGISGNPAPSPSLHPAILRLLRQFLKVQLDIGQSVEFGAEQCESYAAFLRCQPISPYSVGFQLSLLARCCNYILGKGPATEALNIEIRKQNIISRAQPKRKDIFLRKTELTLEKIFIKGVDSLDEIVVNRNHDVWFSAVRYGAGSRIALMALAISAAPRLADTTRLIVGRDIWWSPDLGWEIDYISQKTGEATDPPIDPDLFPLLDQAILHGADDHLFEVLYNKRCGTPFLVKNAAFEPYAYEWPSNRFREMFGAGLHIVRTLWYDRCAEEGYDELLIAQVICAHGSRRSRKHYLSDYGRWKLAERATAMLVDIAKEL